MLKMKTGIQSDQRLDSVRAGAGAGDLHGARPPAMGLARSDSSVSRVWWLISLAQAGPSSRKVGVAFLTLSLDDNR